MNTTDIERALTSQQIEAIRTIAWRAAAQHVNLYIVGGVVRDLLLGRRVTDIDLIVEGDALALAAALSSEGEWTVASHPAFGTVRVERNGLTVDVATARLETYARPGALPEVHPGSLKDDLRRRDFTVNAIAVQVIEEGFGETIDPYGGRQDLSLRLIRILHGRSFIDDPTRMFRAIRYEQRLGFSLEAKTERLLRQNVAGLSNISGDRIRHELELILNEETPEKALLRAGELGLLEQVQPSFKGDAWLGRKYVEARQRTLASEAVYLALLAYRLDNVEALILRLKPSRAIARALRDSTELKKDLPQLAGTTVRPSQVCDLLEPFEPDAIAANLIATDDSKVKVRLALYLNELCKVRPMLTGADLGRLGVPKGKQIGEALHELKRARLDGQLTTREQEEAFVLGILGKTSR